MVYGVVHDRIQRILWLLFLSTEEYMVVVKNVLQTRRHVQLDITQNLSDVHIVDVQNGACKHCFV